MIAEFIRAARQPVPLLDPPVHVLGQCGHSQSVHYGIRDLSNKREIYYIVEHQLKDTYAHCKKYCAWQTFSKILESSVGLAWSERAGERSGVYLASGAEGHEYIVYLYSVYRIAT